MIKQTAINLSQTLDSLGMPILGSSAQSIDTASDRHLFEEFLSNIDIPNPPGAAVANLEQALVVAQEIGYPVLVRPSYVLGGRAMEIVYDDGELLNYVRRAAEVSPEDPIIIDAFLEDAFEFDVDALCDGAEVYIAGVMEHIEEAGIHSGDSSCVLPPHWVSDSELEQIKY